MATTPKTLPAEGPAESVKVGIPPWPVWLGVVFLIFIFFASQYFGSFIVSIYPLIKHMPYAAAVKWLNNDIFAQFTYVLLAEAFSVGAIFGFLRFYKQGFGAIALRRPRWRDPLWGLLMVPLYIGSFVVAVTIISRLIPAFNPNEKQQIGFTSVHGPAQLIFTGISLIILPAIAEEIMVRGFLYTTLKKWLPRFWAVIITSAMFASAHLPEGGGAGLLWVAALDTFILSLFLIYLREKTNNLWASMTLHAAKNSIAYYTLYLSPLIHLHL